MMNTRLANAALAFSLLASTAALAHPGHDHGSTVGGTWHHLMWLAIPAAAGMAAWILRKPILERIRKRWE